jgi:hypothetical protein
VRWFSIAGGGRCAAGALKFDVIGSHGFTSRTCTNNKQSVAVLTQRLKELMMELLLEQPMSTNGVICEATAST